VSVPLGLRDKRLRGPDTLAQNVDDDPRGPKRFGWLTAPTVTHGNLLVFLIAGYVAFCVMYLGSAAVSRTAVELTPTAVDRALPFIGASIFVYLSQFVLLPYALVIARDDQSRSQGFYSMLLATLFAVVIFVCYPTSLMRPTPPADGLLGLIWRGLHLADTSSNVFPSLHVALAAISGAVLWQAKRRVLAIAWPMLISISTLTTRQHIVWDVAGGLLLALVAWRFTLAFVSYERTHAPDRSASR